MAELDQAPKLPSSTSGNLSGYAPISGAAVTSLAVAAKFTIILIVGLISTRSGQSFIYPTLLAMPAFAVVLAFVARRQILNSEGTRTGEQYANWGWYVGVISGLVYVTYLFAIEFTIRNDAERELSTFTDKMLKLDPNNPQDPALYGAIYQLIPPGQRATLANNTDAAGMESSYKEMIIAFKATDLVKLCSRNAGDIKYRSTGMVSWEQTTTEINCAIRGTLTTLEGEHEVVIALKASIEADRKRRWMVVPSKEGFVKSEKLTQYGWAMKLLELSGRQFCQETMTVLSIPNASDLALLGFVSPGWNFGSAKKYLENIGQTREPRMALVGTFGMSVPLPAGSAEMIPNKLFGKLDGQPLGEIEKMKFREVWVYPQRITPAGATLRGNPDTAATLKFSDTILFTQSAELILAQEGQNPPTARAKLICGVSAEESAEILKRLNQYKDAAKTAQATEIPPEELKDFAPSVKWRLQRILSDLKPVTMPREPSQGPGGMGGMGM
ncbi:MAG: hypothetical protein ACRC8S_21960 [Fimbriiglobus sp.]